MIVYIYCQSALILFLSFNVAMQKENLNPNQCLFLNPKINAQLYTQKSYNNSPLCHKHSQKIGHYFCYQCLCYNICRECLKDHQGHQIQQFKDFEEAKEATKENLLVEVEQTLNRLKGRENEMKNQIEEINLIKEKISSQAGELVTSLRFQADQLQRKVKEKMDSQFYRYEKELETFYRQYDQVNNYLRQNLLEIIDGDVNLQTFDRNCIIKDVNLKLVPNYGKIKQVMQKCKKYLKKVKLSMNDLENSIRFFSNEEQKSQAKFDKYDKFLQQKTSNDSDYNSPLLRTLNYLQYNQNDLNLLKSKLHT